jgi:hypothetical protein
MKTLPIYIIIIIIVSMTSCNNKGGHPRSDGSVVLLHHSTGYNIWYGDKTTIKSRVLRKLGGGSAMKAWFREYNRNNGSAYLIKELYFPAHGQSRTFGNFPFDYYDLWVKNAGDQPVGEDPTLEILSRDYDMVVWKHCFPVGNILEDTGNPDINSPEKRVENYKLQYQALKKKMLEFPDTRFLVWTGAALLEENTTAEEAQRAREFFRWVKESWDEPGDNIYIWDFYQLETEGGLYMKKEHADGPGDSHPNSRFSGAVHKMLCSRIVDVFEHDGKKTSPTGEPLRGQ